MRADLGGHQFFAGLGASAIQLIAGCGSNVRLAAGECIFSEGEAASRFFLIRLLDLYGSAPAAGGSGHAITGLWPL